MRYILLVIPALIIGFSKVSLAQGAGYMFNGGTGYLLPLDDSNPKFNSKLAAESIEADQLLEYEMPVNSPYFRIFEFGLNGWENRVFTDNDYIVSITQVDSVAEWVSQFPIFRVFCGFEMYIKIKKAKSGTLVGYYKGRHGNVISQDRCFARDYPGSSFPALESAGRQMAGGRQLEGNSTIKNNH